MKYWHVIKNKNSIVVKPSKEIECTKVKNSIASFKFREGAIQQANNTKLN
jgi:hypothetical protein